MADFGHFGGPGSCRLPGRDGLSLALGCEGRPATRPKVHRTDPWKVCLEAQGTYYLLLNCTYQPDIGSLSMVVLSMLGWQVDFLSR